MSHILQARQVRVFWRNKAARDQYQLWLMLLSMRTAPIQTKKLPKSSRRWSMQNKRFLVLLLKVEFYQREKSEMRVRVASHITEIQSLHVMCAHPIFALLGGITTITIQSNSNKSVFLWWYNGGSLTMLNASTLPKMHFSMILLTHASQ